VSTTQEMLVFSAGWFIYDQLIITVLKAWFQTFQSSETHSLDSERDFWVLQAADGTICELHAYGSVLGASRLWQCKALLSHSVALQ